MNTAIVNHRSLMSHNCFDYYKARQVDKPHAIEGWVYLENVFDFNSLKLVGLRKEKLSSDEEIIVKHIVGGQGNLWTDRFSKQA
ncbi:MAG: hypothetical protein EZS28_029436 [Streblomastix strix]|uniref:Uncharacterized protein n=1 Tax=Streblomastix strix TaxID=222440 RepID=A0A5J4UXH6_9EUKA|nr:MAG: hypothetical protein EZS28_029436 [Streblomastix strix]